MNGLQGHVATLQHFAPSTLNVAEYACINARTLQGGSRQSNQTTPAHTPFQKAVFPFVTPRVWLEGALDAQQGLQPFLLWAINRQLQPWLIQKACLFSWLQLQQLTDDTASMLLLLLILLLLQLQGVLMLQLQVLLQLLECLLL